MSGQELLLGFRPLKLKIIALVLSTSFLLLSLSLTSITEASGTAKDGKDDLTGDKVFNNRHLSQNDERLLDYLRKHHLNPPSKKRYPSKLEFPVRYFLEKYNDNLRELFPEVMANGLSEEVLDRTEKTNTFIMDILDKKASGFFVEYVYDLPWSMAKADSVFPNPSENRYPTTFVLELDFGWTGFLARPYLMEKDILVSNWKVWSADICLSSVDYPTMVDTKMVRNKKYLKSTVASKGKSAAFQEPNFLERAFIDAEKPAFPLFSVLSALNVSTVDVFFLHHSYKELDILKTIPFHLITIKIICVRTPVFFKEALEVPEDWKLLAQAIVDFLVPKGYTFAKEYIPDDFQGVDLIFVDASVPLNKY